MAWATFYLLATPLVFSKERIPAMPKMPDNITQSWSASSTGDINFHLFNIITSFFDIFFH
jgi:hypothetical protein